jgi:ribonuclease-3
LGRRSTTSPRTSSRAPSGNPEPLRKLIEALPQERYDHVFTHPHWAPDRASSYERLEFLGDSVLELAVGRALYDRYPDFSEGRMTKIRAHVVSRAACASVARDLDLGERLRERAAGIGDGEDAESLSRNRNILAALLEAALAALYLDLGFEAVEGAVVEAFSGQIQYALTTPVDSKTELQEVLARDGKKASYQVLQVEGPPHDRVFTCAVVVNGEQLGNGRGRSKKEAEQEAARMALDSLGVVRAQVTV